MLIPVGRAVFLVNLTEKDRAAVFGSRVKGGLRRRLAFSAQPTVGQQRVFADR
jgi:hypothetical protein